MMASQAVYHFIPEDATFEHRLLTRLGSCQQAILASAFFTFGACQSLKPALLDALKRGASVTFLIGRFDFVTEPKAVSTLVSLSKKYPENLAVLFDSDYAFHYKLALFRTKNKPIVIIGSSNLTPKGLEAVGEVNLEIVGNRSVYQQAAELLRKRLSQAVPAVDAIDEYRRRYKHARKYRRQRQRWSHTGQKTWTPRRRKLRAFSEPEGDRFTYCWIGYREKDKKLIQNIRRKETQAKVRGEPFVHQWVHFGGIRYGRLFEEGKDFVIVDDTTRSFGFAYCVRKFTTLDRRERQRLIVFYRFRRGWKAHFETRGDYERSLDTLGLKFDYDRTTIEASYSSRLKRYLKRRGRRR